MARSSELLENNRDILVNLIEVPKALSWLMHNKILDECDRETITNKHITSVMRAGELIDTIKKRESRGCDLLMEFIEYEYPEIFEKIQGRKARSDPTGYLQWEQQQPRISQIYKEGLENILDAYQHSRQMSKKTEQIIQSLQDKIETVEKELSMKQKQITILSQENFEIKQLNKKLVEQLQEHREHLKEQEALCRKKEKEIEMLQAIKHEAMKETVASIRRTCSEMKREPLNKTPSSNNPRIPACCAEELKKDQIHITKLENDKQLLEQIKYLTDQLELQQAEHEEEKKHLKSELEEIRHQVACLNEKNTKLQEEVNQREMIEINLKKKLNVMTSEQKEKSHIANHLISSVPIFVSTCPDSTATSLEDKIQKPKPSSDKEGTNIQVTSYSRTSGKRDTEDPKSPPPQLLRSVSGDPNKREERVVKGSGQLWKRDSTDH